MANLNTNISPSPVVAVRSQSRKTKTNATNSVTVSLGVNPTGATLSGTVTKSAVSGLATFNDLKINRSGEGFTLVATSSGLRLATSAAFNIATTLVFTTQPATAAPGATLADIVVTVRDSAGNTDTNYNGDVSIALFAGAGLGILSGLTTRLASSGVATFSGLSIDDEGTYSLRATASASSSGAYTPASAVSNTFDISSGTDYTLVAADILMDGSLIGFQDGVDGSITPTTYQGSVIDIFDTDNDNHETRLELAGVLSQNVFSSIEVNSFTIYSSTAIFSGAGPSLWRWVGVEATPTVSTYPMRINF